MTYDEWTTSTDAPAMLEALYLQDPPHFKILVPTLHRFFLACCWKIKHLIPQEEMRDGLRGAEKWIDGKIDDEKLCDFVWHVEAVAFGIDQAEDPEDIKEIKALISSITELDGMPYEQAKQLLMDAAYFTDSAMVYPAISTGPFDRALCKSKFLCPNLLREFIQPTFEGEPQQKLLGPFKFLPRTAFGKMKGQLPKF